MSVKGPVNKLTVFLSESQTFNQNRVGVEELWEFPLSEKSTPIVTGPILTHTHILTGICGKV